MLHLKKECNIKIAFDCVESMSVSTQKLIEKGKVGNDVDIWTNIQSARQPGSVVSAASPSNLELVKANSVSVDNINTGISGERHVEMESMTDLFSISEKEHVHNDNVLGDQVEGAVDDAANLADIQNETENENNDNQLQFGHDDEKIDILYEGETNVENN